MPIVFIAVQCYQCSTMQVKQQKKSSNKWDCVVCGEKQSLRKVFARGFQAKDVRKFVQGFNMARQVAAADDDAEETPISTPEHHNQSPSKRRCDWTEYLDLEDGPEQDGTGGDCEPVIVTELPKEMFKKPKLTNYMAGTNKSEKKLYSPTFEKRKPSNKAKQTYSQTKNYSGGGSNKSQGKKLYSPTFAKRKTDDTASKLHDHKGVVKTPPTLGQEPSKWSDYLAEDEDYMLFGTGDDLNDAQGPWINGMLETSFSAQRVEEEVHPDFH